MEGHRGSSPRLPRVVIVGAGCGGLAAATALKNAAVQVTIIDRRNYHLFQPLLYQVATAALSDGGVALAERLIKGGAGFELEDRSGRGPLAIASEVVATSALKASYGMTRLAPAVLVVIGYGAAFYLLAQTLKTLPVGAVYAIWSGLGMVGVALIGAILFGEPIGAVKLAGIALIIAGVALLKSVI